MARNVWNIVHIVMNRYVIHSLANLQKRNGDLHSLTMIMICMMVIIVIIKRKQIQYYLMKVGKYEVED
jgi:hypothetical protein